MSGKIVLARLLERLTLSVARSSQAVFRDERNVEVFLAAALRDSQPLADIRDPAGYIEFLRGCFERVAFTIKEAKVDSDKSDAAAKRFSTLLGTLNAGASPISFQSAQRLALAADRLGSSSQPVEREWEWAGDVGLHFRWVTSTLGRKGRLLSNIIRFSRTERGLELGTAYGMSTMFILEAMKANGVAGRVATLEAMEPQFSIASEALKRQYGEMVSCHLGSTRDALPDLVRSLGQLDFLFHDAGHTREDYVSDFGAVEKALVPGSVVLFDDIQMQAPFMKAPARTYEGWREVVGHPRVRYAVEIEGMGLLLLR